MVKVGKYDYEKSTRKGKKLMVKVNNKTIHFGNDKYEHYEALVASYIDKSGYFQCTTYMDFTGKITKKKCTCNSINVIHKNSLTHSQLIQGAIEQVP